MYERPRQNHRAGEFGILCGSIGVIIAEKWEGWRMILIPISALIIFSLITKMVYRQAKKKRAAEFFWFLGLFFFVITASIFSWGFYGIHSCKSNMESTNSVCIRLSNENSNLLVWMKATNDNCRMEVTKLKERAKTSEQKYDDLNADYEHIERILQAARDTLNATNNALVNATDESHAPNRLLDSAIKEFSRGNYKNTMDYLSLFYRKREEIWSEDQWHKFDFKARPLWAACEYMTNMTHDGEVKFEKVLRQITEDALGSDDLSASGQEQQILTPILSDHMPTSVHSIIDTNYFKLRN